jgi:hypothetical protein
MKVLAGMFLFLPIWYLYYSILFFLFRKHLDVEKHFSTILFLGFLLTLATYGICLLFA